jgi:hypothetical protein
VVLVDHFYDLFYQLLNSQSGEFTKNLAALIIELTFLFACLLFVVLTYFVYYKQKYNTRMATNPAKQKQLDYQFKTLDG